MSDSPMGRHVVVTGSASGIGATAARMLREAGDRVTGVDLRDADVVADLSTPVGRSTAAEAAVAAGGGVVDAVVACAGTASLTPLDVAVNHFGVVDFLDLVRPALAQSQSPRVVVVSSISATQDHDPELLARCEARDEEGALARAKQLHDDGTGAHLYTTSKRALTHWVREVAVTAEWAGAGIALNAVGPGVVDTPMAAPAQATQESRDLVARLVPSRYGGIVPPEVVAETLLWLIRPANTNITGQMLFVDGGAEAVVRGPAAF